MRFVALLSMVAVPLSVSSDPSLESFANLTAVSPAVAPAEGNSMIDGGVFSLTRFTSAGGLVVSPGNAYAFAEDGNYLRWNSRTNDELRLRITPPLDLRDDQGTPAPLRMAFAYRADTVSPIGASAISLLKVESLPTTIFGMEIADGELAVSAINNVPLTTLGPGYFSEETVGVWQVLVVEAQFGDAAESSYRVWLAPEGGKLKLIGVVDPPFNNFFADPIVSTVTFFASTVPANQSGAEVSFDELRFYDATDVTTSDEFLSAVARDYQLTLPDRSETWVVQ